MACVDHIERIQFTVLPEFAFLYNIYRYAVRQISYMIEPWKHTRKYVFTFHIGIHIPEICISKQTQHRYMCGYSKNGHFKWLWPSRWIQIICSSMRNRPNADVWQQLCALLASFWNYFHTLFNSVYSLYWYVCVCVCLVQIFSAWYQLN